MSIQATNIIVGDRVKSSRQKNVRTRHVTSMDELRGTRPSTKEYVAVETDSVSDGTPIRKRSSKYLADMYDTVNLPSFHEDDK